MNETPDWREQQILREVLRAIRQIRYGSVEIVIHDACVVQIERRERVRMVVGDPDRARRA